MKNIIFLIKILICYFFIVLTVFAAKADYFNKGKELFDKNEFEQSKILFERDIVFNPKNEKSYLYLAKIFYKNENDKRTRN